MLFRSRPLPAAPSRPPGRSKATLFLTILIQNRYFSGPGRSRPPAPTGQLYFKFILPAEFNVTVLNLL